MLNIRIARVDDVPTILAFIRELAEYEKLLPEVVADEAALRATLFEKPSAEVLIGELDGKSVGFALFFTSYSTFLGKPGLYLEDLFVRPEARGKGVGAGLMAACARIATDRNYGRFEWSVLDWNEPALGFYRKLGARAMTDWTVHRLTGEPLAELAKHSPSVTR